jgi:hypothetical protein
MGCCFGKASTTREIEVRDLNKEVANEALICKLGARGEKIKVHAGESGFGVSGSGMVLGSCPLDCDTARWEVIIHKLGNSGPGETPSIQIGVQRYNPKQFKVNLNASLLDNEDSKESPAWLLKGVSVGEGDIIGVYWDQTDLPMLSFTRNGQLLGQASINRIRPSTDIYPAIALSGNGGNEVKMVFDDASFKFPPIASKFKMIICSSNII